MLLICPYSVAVKFPYLVQKKLKEGQVIRRVAQLDWKIIESDHEKPFIASGLQFFPLPVTCFNQSPIVLCFSASLLCH